MKYWMSLFAFCLITACTSPVSFDEAKQVPADRLFLYQENNSSSQLLVTRDRGVYGMACNINLYVDGKLTAKFSAGEKATFYLEAGEHILGLDSPCGATLTETPIILREAEKYRARIYIPTGGGITISKTAFN